MIKQLTLLPIMGMLLFSLVGCEKEQPFQLRSTLYGFSVSDNSKVIFAAGNMLYDGVGVTEHQYDYGHFFSYDEAYSLWGRKHDGYGRTLSRSEWQYLLYKRANAEERRASARIDTVNGLILLPDYWVLPRGIEFHPGNNGYSNNLYTLTEWERMEQAGAVFLPASGIMDSGEVVNAGIQGTYFSSTPSGTDDVYITYFNNRRVDIFSVVREGRKYAVRLVMDM